MTSIRGHKRTEFPVSVKRAAFVRCCQQGTKPGIPQCENCGVELNARIGIIYEHLIPDGLGGKPTLENCGVWCKTCSAIKTETQDVPAMAKADRVAKSHLGLKRRKGPPMVGSRDSNVKMKIRGGWEYRR